MDKGGDETAGLGLRLLSGDVLRFRPGEFARMARHRWMVATYLVVLLFLVLLNANGRARGLALEVRVPFFALGVVVALGVLMVPLIALERRAGRLWRVEVPLSPFLFVSTAMGLALADTASRGLGARDGGSLLGFGLLLTFYCLVTEGIALIAAYQVVPAVLADLRRADAARAAASPSQIESRLRIGGREFATGELVYVAAEGSHVRVVCQGHPRLLLPGPMGVVVAGLPPGVGRQVHRSWWVATRAVVEVRRVRRVLSLRLVDGTQVPVAQPRQAEVLDWLADSGLRP
ncbi:MAG: hypothetical protein RIT14_1587 [Pseudomonadota bacterium]